VSGGAVTIYHSGDGKLATTSTGIDVTGTVTSDGLTVDGGASSPTHLFTGTRAGTLVSIDNESASTSYGLLTNTASVSANSYPLWVTSNDLNRLTVGGNGDISFYEDTGTTAKFFWDASAESLGIGTTSPSGNLEIATSASDTGVDFVLDGNKTSNGGVGSIIFNNNGDSVGMIRSNRASANDAADMLFYTQATGGSNTERMRIDSLGNVGIGTSSPNSYSGQTTLNINSTGVARLDLDINNSMQGYLLAESGYTGLFTPSGSNSLRFGTNNAERMRIDSSGRVGIGTSSLGGGRGLTVANGGISVTSANLSHSASSLVLGQDISNVSQIRFYGPNSSAAGILQFVGSSSNGSVGGERMRIESSGNVGIGTNSPDLKLDVSHNVSSEYVATFQNTADNLELKIGTTTGGALNIQGANASNNAAYDIALNAEGGNVGIGTSSPSRRLHVKNTGDSFVATFEGATNSYTSWVNTSGTAGYIGSANGLGSGGVGDLAVRSEANLIFLTNAGSERMRIDSSGNVGIGTSSPNASLHISKSDDARLVLTDTGDSCTFMVRSDGGNTSIGTDTAHPVRFMTNNSERMRIDSSGNLLVGTTDNQPPTNNDASGIALRTDGKIAASRSNGISGDFNTGTNGSLIWLRKSGTVVGKIDVSPDGFGLGSVATGIYFNDGDDAIIPAGSSGSFISSRDNAIDLGRTNARYKNVHAVNYYGDGSNLTGVGGSTTLGAVGTYALLRAVTSTIKTPGSTVSGSSMYYANAFAANSGDGYYSPVQPTGTWRIMGNLGYYNGTVTYTGTQAYQITVCVRIS
jgi:hypothetical protein